MSDPMPDIEPNDLTTQIMDVMSTHERKSLPNIQRNRYMQGCTCGWIGWPHSDHRQLELYTVLLRLQVADPPEGADHA